jgi:hypothetical protein
MATIAATAHPTGIALLDGHISTIINTPTTNMGKAARITSINKAPLFRIFESKIQSSPISV